MRRYVDELWARREFAYYMAMGNLRSRNASTTLGLLWWVLNPLLLGIVYWIVFGIVLPISRDLSFLLSGVFIFYYTSTSVTGGANSIISNSKLLANIAFPRLILPTTAVLEAAIGFLASLVALFLIIGPVYGIWPSLTTLPLLPVVFAVHTAFNLGMSSAAARIAVPFRDVNNLLPYLLRLWLYLSPIIYHPELAEDLEGFWYTLYHLNPMVPILAFYRHALLGAPLEAYDVWASVAWATIVFVVAVAAFVRYEGRIARYL